MNKQTFTATVRDTDVDHIDPVVVRHKLAPPGDGMTCYRKTVATDVDLQVELVIDVDLLMARIASAAARTRTGKAQLLGGAVSARVLDRIPVRTTVIENRTLADTKPSAYVYVTTTPKENPACA